MRTEPVDGRRRPRRPDQPAGDRLRAAGERYAPDAHQPCATSRTRWGRPLNEGTIVRAAKAADLLIAAWENHPERAPGSAPPRSLETLREHGDVDRLGPATKEGHHVSSSSVVSVSPLGGQLERCAFRVSWQVQQVGRHVEEHRNERRRSSASASSCDEDNADDFSNDELLDACVRLVQEDDARAEDAASKHGPEEALIEEARRELLDHIGSLGDVTGRDRQRLRDAVRRPHDRRASGTVKGLIHDVEVGIETA